MLKFIFFLSIACLFFFNCSDGVGKSPKNTSMSLISSFPNEKDDFFFQYPNQFSYSENQIVVNDQPASKAYIIDLNDLKVKGIGRNGRGPGEFSNPLSVFNNGKNLYVNDAGNFRFHHYFKDSLVSTTNYSKSIHEFIVYNENYITYIDDPSFQSQNSLFTVFDKQGEVVKEFGEELSLFEKANRSINKPILKLFENNLYVLFRYYPILRIYDLENYKLKSEIDLNDIKYNYKELVPNNYSAESFNDPSGGISNRYLFKSLDVDKNQISISIHAKKLIIDEYSFDFEFIDRLIYSEVEDNYYTFDHFYNNGKYYVLNRNGFSQISTFETNE